MFYNIVFVGQFGSLSAERNCPKSAERSSDLVASWSVSSYVDQRWAGLEAGGHVQDMLDQADHVIVATTLRYAHFRL